MQITGNSFADDARAALTLLGFNGAYPFNGASGGLTAMRWANIYLANARAKSAFARL